MKPYILVEPFCGMAGMSFWLMRSKPPISWMGNKFGYAHVIADLLGLSRHHPPAAFIWSDVGPNVAALATLAGARGDARDVAGWLWTKGHENMHGSDLAPQYMEGWKERKAADSRAWGTEPTRWLIGRTGDIPLPRAPEVANIIRTWKDEEPRALWERLKAAGWPSLMPPKGMRWGQPILGRWLGPCEVGEVAGMLLCHIWQHPAGDKFSQSKAYPVHFKDDAGNVTGTWVPTDAVKLSHSVDALPSRWPRVACYQGTATRMVEQLPGDLSGFLIYVDGPYHGDGSRKITGYKFGGCSREEQLAMAADCHRRGARVAMSESVPLAKELRALTGAEWWEVDITEHREGQSRTFGATREYVTLNAAPKHMRGTQQGLFGAR